MYTVRDTMPLRKVLKIVATVLLIVGALVMLGFLGILIFFTTGTGVAGDVFRYKDDNCAKCTIFF